MLPLLHRPGTSSFSGDRATGFTGLGSLAGITSAPGSPIHSPKRAGLGSGYLSAPPGPSTLGISGSQGGAPGGFSQFQTQHENVLRKNRNHFIGQSAQYGIDYHAAHNKALAELPVLQEQHSLEVEEYQHALEETVSRHIARISQLRNDYSLLVKEASRRHMDLQQRRFAGAKVDLPSTPPSTQPSMLPPLSQQPPISAPPGPGADGRPSSSPAADQAAAHTMGHVSPNAYLKTISADASNAMSQYTTRPPTTPSGITGLALNSPGPSRMAGAMTDPGTRGSDFMRLEGMHDKFMSRTRNHHESSLAARSSEVASWYRTFAACMGALAAHQSNALSHLAGLVEEAEAWHAQQRSGLAGGHDEVMAEADRLGRQIESMQAAAAAKLQGLTASFLDRVLPSGEVGLAEAQAAYTRAASNLRNEHVAALEGAEAMLRALVPRHAAMRGHMAAGYAAGLAAHEAAMAAAGAHYDSRGVPELRRQYEEAEVRHRDALAVIRSEHLKGLAAAREGWMGEAAALLEEYRARMAELKGQYMLQYEVDVTEV